MSSAPPPSSSAPQLDSQSLVRLRELDPDGRMGVIARVLGLFETTLARMVAELVAERGQPDAAVVLNVAHTLKPSSFSVGALGLWGACSDIERRLRDGRPGDLAADLERLITEGEVALAAVGTMLRP